MATRKRVPPRTQQQASETQNETSLEARWGDIILDAGHTSIPNLLLELYTELGISIQEMMFIIHIFNYRWTKKNPFPAIPTIAKKMGVTDRSVQNYIKHLKALHYQTKQEKKARKKPVPFLTVTERYRTDQGQLSNLYDFSGLTAATVKLALAKGLIVDPAQEADGNTPGEKNFTGGGDKNFTGGVKKTSPEEEISNKSQNNKKKDVSRNSNAQKKETAELIEASHHIGGVAIGNTNDTKKPLHQTRNQQSEHKSFAYPPHDPNTSPPSNIETPTQKRTGRGRQASGFTPLSDIIPREHWQVLESQAEGHGIDVVAFISPYITDYSRDLGDDPDKIPSNISRAVNIYHEWGGQDVLFFRTKLGQAKEDALAATRIRKRNSTGGINRIPWFFTDLRDLLGLPATRTQPPDDQDAHTLFV